MNEESFLENLGKQMVVNEGDQIAAHHMFGEMPQPIAAESVCRVEDTVEGKSEVGDEDTVPRGVEYNLALGGKQDDDMGKCLTRFQLQPIRQASSPMGLHSLMFCISQEV
ncbi:hypothetical protein U1Q18_014484, partial [Sarracenia purpurea var. burkii]